MLNSIIFIIIIICAIIVGLVLYFLLYSRNKPNHSKLERSYLKSIINDKTLLEKSDLLIIRKVNEKYISFKNKKMRNETQFYWIDISRIIVIPQIRGIAVILKQRKNKIEELPILIAPEMTILRETIRILKNISIIEKRIVTRFLPEIKYLENGFSINELFFNFNEILSIEFNGDGKYLLIRKRNSKCEKIFILLDKQYKQLFEYLLKKKIKVNFILDW
jgi:uncharacterized protein YpmB